MPAGRESVLALLADGAAHNVTELDALALPREVMRRLLRELCDEEIITVKGENIELKNKKL
jgi:hypothetical protein